MNARTLTATFATVLLGTTTAFAAPPPKASPAFANPGFANPDTPGLAAGKADPNVANVADVVFLRQMALGNRAELELGRVANERGQFPDVKSFGDAMSRDHGAASKDLAGLAHGARVNLPDDLDPERTAQKNELSKLQGEAFDRRYVEMQVKDHQAATELLIHEIGAGQHAGVRDFASRTLPVVMQHLEQARALHDQMNGHVPRDSAPRPAPAQKR